MLSLVMQVMSSRDQNEGRQIEQLKRMTANVLLVNFFCPNELLEEDPMSDKNDFGALSQIFDEVSYECKGIIKRLIDKIDAGYSPLESETEDFNFVVAQLRVCHQNIMTYFETLSDVTLKENKEYSLNELQEIFNSSTAAHRYQEEQRVFELLHEFQRVYSVAVAFDNALEPYRKTVSIMID